MGNPLQLRQTPRELAARSQLVEISIKIGDFKQLSGIAEANLAALDDEKAPQDWRDRQVSGELQFDFVDAQSKTPAMTGWLAAQIDAVCQRCLEPFVLPLKSELRLVFGEEQGVGHDGEAYEAWELDDETLDVAELVEEALIMSIPFVTMHQDDADCRRDVAPAEEKANTTLPFANLKAQMQQED